MASLDTAYANNEQLLILSGGPTVKPADIVSDWLNDASGDDKAEKAVWLLKGGFTQATHGWDTGDLAEDDTLDYTRELDIPRPFFNIRIQGENQTVHDVYEDLYNEIEDAAEAGIGSAFSQAEYNALEADFVPNALLVSLEDQNQTDAVRGDADVISDRIGDDLARDTALEYSKSNGNEIDFSDVGLLGLIHGDGNTPLQLDDIEDILSDDLLF